MRLTRLWNFCCSLKLAISLASIATLLSMGGSLLIHFNPQVFAGLDALSLADWHQRFGSQAPLLSSWFYLTGILLILLGLNTLCCFVDWLLHLRVRWRKCGEYLIHLGFVLLLIAYFWGSFGGDRRAGIFLQPGELRPLPFHPGYFLRLEAIEPVYGSNGRPVDIRHHIAVLHGDATVTTATLQANTPLIFADTIIVASGSGQQIYGYQVVLPDLGGSANLVAGALLPLRDSKTLRIDSIDFEAPLAPLLRLTLLENGTERWNGWYSMRQQLPDRLASAGFRPVVRAPLQHPYSELTLNNDPGWRLALVACCLLSLGAISALYSFYAKRRRGDRPDIA